MSILNTYRKACATSRRRLRGQGRAQGFTLVEMLAVLAIVGILTTLVAVSFASILSAAFTSEVSDIASILVRARAYAMANNTYTFVGIQEVSAATSATTTPQTAGSGRIGVVVVATNDGTCGYLPSITTTKSLPDNASTGTSTQLVVVTPLRHFENIHMRGSLAKTIASGNVEIGSVFSLAYNSLYKCPSLTTFNWPLSGTAQYSAFGTNSSTVNGSVIQFNPQGEAQIITLVAAGTNSYQSLQWIEIDLEPIHGSTVPTAHKNAAAILIDGPSGNVSIFRQ